MKIEKDSWLSEIFGYPAFKIYGISDPKEISKKGIFIPSPQRAFYYVQIPINNIQLMAAFTSTGFRIAEVRLLLEKKIENHLLEQPSPVLIKKASLSDQKAVLNIAESCFTYSRFHLDPLIEKDIANTIKREWTTNYFLGKRGKRLLIAEWQGETAGFLAELSSPHSNENIGIIDLIGVDKKYQRNGIASALIRYLMSDSTENYTALRVTTQLANIPSLNLYQKLGFQIVEASVLLHAHQ